MKTKVTLGLMLLLAAAFAYGVPFTVKANIEFPFTVQDKVLPAGDYTFTRDDAGAVFRVEGMDNKGVLAPIITRLAAFMHGKPLAAHLVFDKVGETLLLSEIWIAGEDGYLVLATKGEHTHKVVKVKK
jgi:hypothetical protein